MLLLGRLYELYRTSFPGGEDYRCGTVLEFPPTDVVDLLGHKIPAIIYKFARLSINASASSVPLMDYATYSIFYFSQARIRYL